MAKIHVIIPAAGSGSRMQHQTPKQFISVGGKSLLESVESIFSNILAIDTISIAINDTDMFIESIRDRFSKKTSIFFSGGETRSETVLNTLNELKIAADDWVIVHDASRIGITESNINNFISNIGDDKVGGIMAIPASDTVKRVNKKNEIISTENRDELWLAQTPQMFRFKILKKALNNFKGFPTDESQAVEALGLKPRVFSGNSLNFKITFSEDLIRAEKTLEILGKKYE